MDYQEMPWSIEDTMDHLDKVRCSLVRQLRKINLHGKAESDIAELNYDFGRAINALKENQEYKQLGTLEEVRKAVERQQAKKPLLGGNTDKLTGDIHICPYCSGIVGVDDMRADFCADCGQHIDWGEENE